MKIHFYHLLKTGLRKAGLLVFAGLLVSGIQAQNSTTGLIMHYSFDNVTETLVPDISGNDKTATLQGAATLVEGYSGTGVNMLTKPDYVQLPADFTVGLTSFTYAAWVNFSALKGNTRFFDLGNGADASNNFLVFIPSNGSDNSTMRVRYRESTGTGFNVDAPATAKCPVNTWAHVAVTLAWDDAANTGTLKIYLNGVVVANNAAFPYNPNMLGISTVDNFLGRSRWNQDANGFNGTQDDVRFYNRALTTDDILSLTGLGELNRQYEALTLGNISEGVTTNLTLPSKLGTQGVNVKWLSSKPAVIDSTGLVTRPTKFDTFVKLTATLSLEVNGKINTMIKEFNVKVLGIEGTPEQIAQWNFASTDISSENDTVKIADAIGGYRAILLNEAKIRTIGNTTQYNVLDLGNGKGYMDMGKEIGEAIYALNNYTIMGYFRVHEDYTAINAAGNFLYAFSNTSEANVDRNGYLIGRLNVTGHQCTKYYWGDAATRLEVAVGTPAPTGEWHHYAYVQDGTTGRIFIDGVLAKEGPMAQVPSTTIALGDRSGTLYNWIGRSIGLASDSYLKQTLVYDFNVYSVPITSDNLILDFEVPGTLSMLNNAYAENPDYKSPALQSEYDNLTLPDLSAVTSDVSLPATGSLDQTISITWKSSHEDIISNTGVVKRPDYFNFNVTLTATLASGISKMTKEFPATVLVKPGTEFLGDLIAKFDFSSIEGRFVNDVAEKKFQGMTVNDATIRLIGTPESGQFNVLDLGNGTGYFDMGQEIGKTLYHLNDYSMSAFYRVDTAYHELNSNGNFLWTFSNTDDAMAKQNGYIIGSLKNLSQSITPGFYTAETGNQSLAFAQPALPGNWHHFAYTQSGGIGTIFMDGIATFTGDITNTPASSLLKGGRMGTLYNWIGRSNYITDVYLRNTLVYDFRLYKKALSDFEIFETELKVTNLLEKLEAAYLANPNASGVKQTLINSPYKVIPVQGGVRIMGLTGDENVSLFDISGRRIQAVNSSEFKANPGIYIVRINNYSSKIMVN